MRKALLAAVLVAVTLPASPALAHRDNRYHNHNGNHRVYDSRGRYVEPRRLGRCLLYTSPSPRDRTRSRMPSSA